MRDLGPRPPTYQPLPSSGSSRRVQTGPQMVTYSLQADFQDSRQQVCWVCLAQSLQIFSTRNISTGKFFIKAPDFWLFLWRKKKKRLLGRWAHIPACQDCLKPTVQPLSDLLQMQAGTCYLTQGLLSWVAVDLGISRIPGECAVRGPGGRGLRWAPSSLHTPYLLQARSCAEPPCPGSPPTTHLLYVSLISSQQEGRHAGEIPQPRVEVWPAPRPQHSGGAGPLQVGFLSHLSQVQGPGRRSRTWLMLGLSCEADSQGGGCGARHAWDRLPAPLLMSDVPPGESWR